MLTIIGLVGAKGAGKNTFAKMLVERLPDAREGALADRLKEACSTAFRIPRKMFDDPAWKERYVGGLWAYDEDGVMRLADEPVVPTRHSIAYILDAFGYQPTEALVEPHVGKYLYTSRQIAQYVGTEVLRAISPEIHCLGLMKDQPQEGYLVVTDIRFPNELQFFKNLPGVRFVSVAIQRTTAETKAAADGHESERHTPSLIAQCDHAVGNNGSVALLESVAEEFVKNVFGVSKEAE